MSDEFPEIPPVSGQLVQAVAETLPAIPGIESIMGAVMMAIMPMVTGGMTCDCDVCQTLSGVFTGLQQ